MLELTDLLPDTEYTVTFTDGSGDFNGAECDWRLPTGLGSQTATIRTFPDPASRSAPPFALAILSCDRYFDDSDDGLWRTLLPNSGAGLPVSELRGIVHIGDQVYTDSLGDAIIRNNQSYTFTVRAL